MNYQPSTPVRVTERGQMKRGDVLRFVTAGESCEGVFVRGPDKNWFQAIYEVPFLRASHPYHLQLHSYADNQIPCPHAYTTATNYVEIVGSVPSEQVDAMLSDCLDCTQ